MIRDPRAVPRPAWMWVCRPRPARGAAGPLGQPAAAASAPSPARASAGSARGTSTVIRTLRPVNESDNGPPDRRRLFSLRTARMEAFSDGIFAIASTLLVLDLAIPAVSSDVAKSLAEQWPTYLAYLVSFATIGNAWLNHSVITEYLERADAILLRLNLVLLFFVSALPYPTHMVAEYIDSENAERIAVTVYGLSLLAISAFTSLTWHYAISEGLIRRDNKEEEVRAISRKLDPSLVSYAIAIGIGLLWPQVAVVLYLIIALFVIIPFRAVFRLIRRGRTRALTGHD